MKHPFLKAIATLAGVFTLMPSFAQAQEPMRYEVMQRHLAEEPAQMRIIANAGLSDVDVNITNCTTQPVRRHFDKISAGEMKTIKWEQPGGTYNCGINISGKTGMNDTFSVRNFHEFISASPIQLNVNLRELSPESNNVVLHATHPFTKASIVVTAEDGTEIDSVEQRVGNVKEYKLSWTPNKKKPALLEIKIADDSGSWATNTIFYFRIPHTDIVFDTGKSNIRKDQDPYLKETLNDIMDILAKHSRVAVDLYITGHTDTVGSASSNIKLSLKRAKSIAAWFKQHGLNIPIYYRGAGERALAVDTPDNTPNEKNRRAVYILSNRPPMETVDLGGYQKLN